VKKGEYMAFDKNFEKHWLDKLQIGLKKISNADLFIELTKNKNEQPLLEWTKKLMKILEEKLTQEEINKVMTGCACQAPKDNLKILQEEFSESKNIEFIHKKLQEIFERFIKQYKNLDDEQMKFLRENGWGMAGKLKGNVIYATKIPKEFHKYFQTDDPQKKKYYYCHCPRIRELFLNNEQSLDLNYCYCGAGFYQDIWEFILQKKVHVEIIKSLMKGDEVCKIAIYI